MDKAGGSGRGPEAVAEVKPGADGVTGRQAFPEGYRRMFLAAVDAFSERGFHATSTRDIAARAGLSPAAVYVHFSSKEELLFQIVRIGHDLAYDVMAEAAEQAGAGPVARLRSVVAAFAAWQATRHSAAWVVQYQLDPLSPEHLEIVVAQRSRIDRFVRGLITDGIASGDFSVPSVSLAALAILSLCLDITRWYQPESPVTPEKLGESYAGIALRIVGAA